MKPRDRHGRSRDVDRRLGENVVLPLLYRRTWSRVRAALEEYRAAEALAPDAVVERSVRRAVETARGAGARSPFLRDLYGRGGVDLGALSSAEDFARLPILTKEMVRAHADDLVTEDADRSDLVAGATGGSTGVPMPYYHDTDYWCRATAAAMRGDEWAGWRLGERQASVWGTPMHESRRDAALRATMERLRNFLFVPGFDLSPAAADDAIRRVAEWRPVLLSGYASILASLARRMAETGGLPEPPRGVVSSAEPLRQDERALVEEAFRAPVFDRYGCREAGLIAQECVEHAGLHIAAERVYVEVVDDVGRPADPGETGRVLVTVLDTGSFPLVRYEVGDLAVVAEPSPCACGNPLPRLARVEGRLLDILHTARGGALTGVFFPHLMKEFPWVRAFQVVQDATGDVELRVVPETPRVPADRQQEVVRAVENAMGDGVGVTLRLVDELERTASGKVRVTRSDWRPAAGRRPGTRACAASGPSS